MRRGTKSLFFVVLCLSFILVPFFALTDFPLSIEQPDVALADINRPIPQYLTLPNITPPLEMCDSCLEELRNVPIEQKPHFQEWLRKGLRQIFSTDIWVTYLYMRDLTEQGARARQTNTTVNQEALDMVYVRLNIDEEKEIRDLWARTLGVDVWYPYYQVKHVQNIVKKKLSFKIFKMKCKPSFEKKSVIYTCKKTF